MSTRSLIGIELDTGEIKAVYCHWDGYPSHNGMILNYFYTTRKKAEKLINGGDMSSLYEDIKNISRYKDIDGNPIVYKNIKTAISNMRGCMAEYLYWMDKNGVWYVYDYFRNKKSKLYERLLNDKECRNWEWSKSYLTKPQYKTFMSDYNKMKVCKELKKKNNKTFSVVALTLDTMKGEA